MFVFCSYQMMFAIITPALITGAFTNRVTFKAYLIFLTAWLIFVYFPFVHMVWGGGILASWGVLDFAGGIVVHNVAGIAALASVLYVGKRKVLDRGPHSIPLVALGTGLLWFGWYGFNAGSEFRVDSVTAVAFLNTDVSASFAAIAVIWLGHRQWSRRYGLEDGWTTLLSLAMVFVMLVYVYPLRMVASAFMAFASGGRLPSSFVMSSPADLTGLFVVYGLGFALQTAMLAALHLRALGVPGLRLSALERLLTRHGVVANGLMAATGLLSALAAGLLPSRLGVWAGFVYTTLAVTMPVLSTRFRRAADRLRRTAEE